MVPKGWEVKKLEDVVSKTRKITYGIVVPGPYEPNGNLMIRAKDYSFGWQPIESIYRVSDQMHQSYKRSKVRKGDVLLTIVGSIGNTAIVPEDLEGANITQQTARLSFDEHDANFFYSVMSSGIGKKEIYRYAKSGVQPSLNLADIAKFKVPVPPFQEQQKIAKILSVWDKAISTTERLIENSTQQKKALMQQLLTGKKRLLDESGKWFEGEWADVKQGEVAKFFNGRAYKQSEWEEKGTPVIRLQNLTGRGTNYYYSTLTLPEHQYCNKGDLLYMWSATFGPAIWHGAKAIYHYHIWKVECKAELLHKIYMYYLLDYETQRLMSKTNGMGLMHVTKGTMENQLISLPTFQEQQKIATVLTNADKEIELLEQQLADLQQEKKALMQVLLTGKKRVKLND